MSDDAAPEATPPGLSVIVQHAADGVVIHVAGNSTRQGGLDSESVVTFLSSLDAEQLEKDVLERLGLLTGDGEISYTQALLGRLIVIAKGEW